MPIASITHALSMMPRFDKSYGREEACILKDHGGKNWPSESDLRMHRACIIHGHTPYCYFMKNCFSYGDNNIFWQNQHIFFSEDLQSFDIDSNIKGRYKNGESYRGLCCICLEVFERIAEQNSGHLSIEGIRRPISMIGAARWFFSGLRFLYLVGTAFPLLSTGTSFLLSISTSGRAVSR